MNTPSTNSSPGSSGTSNVIERDGHRYTIRPEKLHVLAEDAPIPDGMSSEKGAISEVVYLGAVTRYVVALDRDGTLTALRQNLEASATEALAERGRRVIVAWRPEHLSAVDAGTEREQETS